MEWHELYPGDKQPTMEEMAAYIGTAGTLWEELHEYIATTYKAKPKYQYSNCGMKPGWNVKYNKSGQAFGTLYPEEGSFSVMIVVSYRLDADMDKMVPLLSPATAEQWGQAGDYMKLGKWMMMRIADKERLEDYKKILAVKLPPKVA